MPCPQGIVLYSTIFKTVQDLTTGKTKITTSGFLGGIFKGDFFKPQSIVSEDDIKALEAYNLQVSQGADFNKAFDDTMKNASQTAQDLAKAAKGAAVDINAIPKTSKAAAVGINALSVAINMLLSIGISIAITALLKGIDYLIHRTEKLREAATNAKETYKGLQTEIDNLNNKLDENNKLIEESGTVAEYDGYRNRLKAENKELERQITLSKIKAQTANDEADQTAKKVLNGKTYTYNKREWTSSSGNSSATLYDSGDISTATDWYLDQAEATGVVDDKLKEYIETIEEQRENLNLLNPESKKLYDNLGLLIDRYTALYPDIKASSDEMDSSSETIDKMTVSLSELENISDSIKPLGTAFKELSDDGYITVKTLKEIKDAADLSSDEWVEYEAKLLKAKVGSSEFNKVMSELTYEILDNAFAEKDLNAVTEQQVAAVLRENGVTNASAVAHGWLTTAKIKNKLATFDFNDATQDEIDTLYKELKALGLTETAIGKLSKAYAEAQSAMLKAASTGALNRLKISQDELKGIKSVADAYNIMAGKGYDVDGDGTGDYYGDEKNRSSFDGYRDQYNADVESVVALAKAQEEIDKIINSIDTGKTSPDYSGAAKDKSDKNEALDNYLKDAENRYKIHQDEVKYIKELQYAYDNLTKSEKERLDITGKINEAYRDLADNRIKDIEHQIDLAKELHGEDFDVTGYYDQIQKVAHDEANRLRAMGYDNNSNEIQGLQKTWWDAQNNKIDFYTKQHENIIRDIEHARDMALEKNPYVDTTSYYRQMQDEYHKQAELLRALDPEKFKEEIQKYQQAWWDAQEAIVDWSYSNSERWINERNTYNDWDLYGDNEIAAWERVLKRFKTEFPNELEKIKEIEQNIFEARKRAMEKSISDIEDYINARNTYNDWDAYGDSEVKAIQRQTKIIEDAYRDRLLSYEEYIDKIEEQTQRIYRLGQDRVDKHLSNIDKYIDARNFYNDWDDFGDTEINAIERQIEVLKNAYRLNLISYEEYTEKVAEYTQKMYSVAKDNIIEEVSKLIEDYEEMKSFESSQLESQKTLLQSYYDVTNAVAEAQHEINKELNASMAMREYLNEETRELLFNQEDYNALNKELLEIQSAADELQKQYQEDILNASAETIAEITSQYQTQYETMMKQYEIAKAELEVAKKRQKLDNVLAERNTRMFINGQWQWVAKTQDVINAQNELAEAEIERKKQEASLEQTEAINGFTEQINSLETDLNKVRKWWSDTQKMLNGEADDVAKALEQISEVASPELKRVIDATGGSITSFSGMLSESTETMYDIIDGDRGFGTMADSISTIITDLESYSDAIKSLVKKLNDKEEDYDDDDDGDSSYSGKTYKVNPDGKAPAGLKVGDKVVTGGGTYEITGVKADGSYESTKVSNTTTDTYKGSYAEAPSSFSGGSSSSGGGSSSSSSGGKTVQVGSDGNAPSGTKVGDTVVTAGGNYLVVPNGTPGSSYNPVSGLSSIKIEEKNADGTRYTSGGMTLMGEEGFEAFITNNGRLIPINQPTLGNIGAGGVVFNREQMANLRNLWDLSNLGKIAPFASSSNTNKQSTVIDNSIHINGLTVSEQGNEDWINGLRRYVVTHK